MLRPIFKNSGQQLHCEAEASRMLVEASIKEFESVPNSFLTYETEAKYFRLLRVHDKLQHRVYRRSLLNH